MTESGKYTDRIVENLSVLRQEIASKGKLGFTDLNKQCENLVKGILNIVYDYNLKNLNEGTTNFPGLDLGDKGKKAFQVTSIKTSDKVDDALATCLKYEHYKTFDSINVFILSSKQNSYALKTVTEPHFIFDEKLNILDFDDVTKKLSNLDLEKLKKLSIFLEDELPYFRNNTNSLEAKPEGAIKDKGLTDVVLSLARSKMKNFSLFKIKITVNTFTKINTPLFYKAISDNLLVRGNMVVPVILQNSYRKSIDSNSVTFEQPLHTDGAVNRFREQHLRLEKNEIYYEFCEYNDSDFTLIYLDTPISTLLFIILILTKWHIEKNTRPNIDFTISIDANNRTAYYSDYSPFYCGHVFEEFKIQGNHFETTDNLCDFSNEAIYELAQSI